MTVSTRLERLYTGILHDVLRSRGIANCVLPSDIRPLADGLKAGGIAFTMEGRPAPGISEHDSLLAWTGFLGEVPAGSVVVCQANDSQVAHMGELSAGTMRSRGARGYVVDGGSRDTRQVLDAGFPVWCRYRTPADIVGRWTVDGIAEPVLIGDVEVHTGDWVLADEDGVVVVPAGMAEEVVTEAEAQAATEDLVRKAILEEGLSPQDAYLRHRKF